MKISYNWLKDIIDIKENPEVTAALLTGCGLEVEGIETYTSIKGGLKGIVIGEVKTCVQHPNADRLRLTKVDVGGENLLQIVCGAPNVAAGQKVLVATIGTTVHPTNGEPFEIKKSKIRGEVSEGMICAEDELSLGESHEGILVLPENYDIGKPATAYFQVYQDFLLEIGLTANRGDAASHLGVARDLKALTGASIKLADTSIPSDSTSFSIGVNVEDQVSCLRYSGLVISNIEVKDSPEWIKNRLGVIGIKPINNIVDATNYVLHELGQPLHAFDADQIQGKQIVVRKAKAGEKFTTLDKVERSLSGSECMICDGEKPMAIGGVFGGLHSGITSATKNIFIESAYFEPASIRKTAKFHGLSTDASFRYERGTDPEITINALGRITQLIIDIAGGQVSSPVVDWYPNPVQPAVIDFSLNRLYRLIGQEIGADEVKNILLGLDIAIIEKSEDNWALTVPAFRVDIKREADIAEEVLRIYGLNRIEIPAQLKSVLTRSADEDAWLLRHRVAEFLAANGFVEMVSNSLTKSAYYQEEELKKAVYMMNPLSSDLDIMRMNMMYNGLEMIQYNVNRKNHDLQGFEFGYTYLKKGNGYDETPHFALFLSGMQEQENWIQPQDAQDFFNLKSLVERVIRKTGLVDTTWIYQSESSNLAHGAKVMKGNLLLAEMGAVKGEALKAFGIDQAVYMADIHWKNVLEALKEKRFAPEPVSGFPSVRRDLALLLDKQINYFDLEKAARKLEPILIKQINVFDVYEGEKIGADKKSYALSFILQDHHKTLTDQEIDGVMKKLIKQFEKEFNASLRTA